MSLTLGSHNLLQRNAGLEIPQSRKPQQALGSLGFFSVFLRDSFSLLPNAKSPDGKLVFYIPIICIARVNTVAGMSHWPLFKLEKHSAFSLAVLFSY